MNQSVVAVTDDNFKQELEGHEWVVADFSAEWCGPCRALAPIFDKVAEELSGKVHFIKVDVDQAQSAAAQYQVTSVPTVVIFKNGQEVDRSIGVKEEDAFLSWITSSM